MARSRLYSNQGRDDGRVYKYNGGNSGSWNKNKVSKTNVAKSKYRSKEKTRKQGPSDTMTLAARPDEVILNLDAILEGKTLVAALPVSAALKTKYENIVSPGHSKTVLVTCTVVYAQVDGCPDIDVAAFYRPPPERRERISIKSGMFDIGQVEGGRHRLLTLEESGLVSVFEGTRLAHDGVVWTEWDRDVSEIESPKKSGAADHLGKKEGWRQLGGFTNRDKKFLRAGCKLEEVFQIKASKTEAGTIFAECTPPIEAGEAMTNGRLKAVKICIYHKEL
jgi:hypothetical protein